MVHEPRIDGYYKVSYLGAREVHFKGLVGVHHVIDQLSSVGPQYSLQCYWCRMEAPQDVAIRLQQAAQLPGGKTVYPLGEERRKQTQWQLVPILHHDY